MEFLFADDGDRPISLKALQAVGRRRTRLRHWFKDVTAKTRNVTTRIRKGKSRPETTAVGVAAIVIGAGGLIMTGDLAGGLAFWLVPLAFFGWLTAARLIPPHLDPELRERVARWTSFRRFLKRFSSLPDAPALAVVIWEQYLVYAVALGVANRVEKQVRALVPSENLPSPWPGAPIGLPGLLATQQLWSVPVAHGVAATAVASGWSSGWGSTASVVGFGGGFGAGGGGGGGGTGGGAG